MSFLKKSIRFLSKDSILPLLAGLASGLYPMAFYYSNNYDFVNSQDHFFFFVTRFLILPIIAFYVIYFLMRKRHVIIFKNLVLPTLNALAFFTLSMFAIYAAIRWKHILAICFLTLGVFILSFFLKKVIKKAIVIQFLLVFTTFYAFFGIIKKHTSYSDLWMQQPDNIKEVVFKKRPNIYVIQSDGYVNFSELKKGYYNYDNNSFEKWLKEQGFVSYENYRSNYKNTIFSNTSMFTMKHHYYKTLNERNVLMNDNAVVSIFNSNNYKTHAFLEAPYFMINRPEIKFDYTNYKIKELPYFTRGLSNRRDIIADFEQAWKNKSEANFYFFEKLQPWHIPVKEYNSRGKEKERISYLERLEMANGWLKEIITVINKLDPNGLIVIMADHGGFVGMNSTSEAVKKLNDRDKIYSIFSSILAVKWVENNPPQFDDKLKTSVNLFRILFSYLSEDESFLTYLQEDASFLQIEEEFIQGIYKCIDSQGNIVFEKQE